MRPLRIQGFTRSMAENQDEYLTLPIRDEIAPDGSNQMVSVWEPSPTELQLLAMGGSVKLTILGTGHPPVKVEALGPPPEDQ